MAKRLRPDQSQLMVVDEAIKSANQNSDDEFIQHHLKSTPEKSSPWVTTWLHEKASSDHVPYHLTLTRSSKTSNEDLKACFNLISETSEDDYRKSSKGWNADDKRREMRDKDLRYIIVKNIDGVVCGFTSFKPDFEEGQPVVYCYEIHLKEVLRHTGVAKVLMGMLETVATNIQGVEKVMLTVFKRNKRALRFYEKFGFVKDDLSPETRRLRGRIMEPDYVILSKTVSRELEATSEASDQRQPSTEDNRPAKMARLTLGDSGDGEGDWESCSETEDVP